MKFNNIKIGQLFRATKPFEMVLTKRVENNGLYLKVGNNVSIDLHKQIDGKPVDCVFDMDMECRVVETKARIPYHEYESYKICAQGAR